jgi:hypothetical protein
LGPVSSDILKVKSREPCDESVDRRANSQLSEKMNLNKSKQAQFGGEDLSNSSSRNVNRALSQVFKGMMDSDSESVQKLQNNQVKSFNNHVD